MRGLTETAANAGASLLCFVGGQLPRDPARASGRHRMYDLCSSRNVDGVVVLSSTLLHGVGQSALGRYCERYRPLPLCSIGVALPGFPSVTIDNEVGIRSVLQHAIVDHGARRIAFVRGPRANAEAELRVAAYEQTLAENGIPFDERLVVTGTFTIESGVEAVRALTDDRGVDLGELDAIAASNDAMAMGVLLELERRGIGVPEQIAVVGFDDIDDARITQPPLTTVRQPLERLGHEALCVTLDWIRRGAQPESRELPTEPVIRRSCGCARPSGRAGPSLGPERSLGFEAALLMKRDRIIGAMTKVARRAFADAGSDWAERLVSALVADLRSPEPSAFVSAFDTLLERLLARGVDLNLCDDVLGALRAQVVPILRSDRSRSERAEDLFHLARLATSHAIQRGLVRERLNVGRWSLAVNSTCTALASALDPSELARRALELLPSLGISSCSAVVYDGASENSARLLFGYADGARLAAPASFDPSWIVPNGLRGAPARGASFVVLPLVFREHNLGHLLLELDLSHSYAYGAIAEAIGVGLYVGSGKGFPLPAI